MKFSVSIKCQKQTINSLSDKENPNFKKNAWIHFVGVGGCGLSALAKLAQNQVCFSFETLYFFHLSDDVGDLKKSKFCSLVLINVEVCSYFLVRALLLVDPILRGVSLWMDYKNLVYSYI